MKIVRMNKGDWGHTKAYFDIKTEEGFIIKGCRIVDAGNGIFISYPSRPKNDGTYDDIVYVDKENVDLRAEVHKTAKERYETPEDLMSGNNTEDAPIINDALQSETNDLPF